MTDVLPPFYFPDIGTNNTTVRSTARDMEALKGDPWDDARWQNEALDPQTREMELDNLRRQIDSLPNGSVSGGILQIEEYMINDTQGYFDHTPKQGLPDATKQILWDEGVRRLNSISRTEYEEIEQVENLTDQMWEHYRIAYPDLARDVQGVAAATNRVRASYQQSGVNPNRMILKDPAYFAEKVAEEQRWGPPGPGLNQQPDYDNSRTSLPWGGGPAGGYTSEQRRERTEQDDYSEMERQIRQEQKRNGYY